MPKIALSGYFGFDNAGDEAILRSMILMLRKAGPDVEIEVLSRDPDRTAREYGVRCVDRWDLRQVVGCLRRCDLLVSGGGSLLQDVTGIRSILYYLGVIAAAKFLGKRVMLCAQGIGPVRTWTGKTALRLAVNKADLVTVRDEESAEELRHLGVVVPPVEVTADATLGCEISAADTRAGTAVLSRLGLKTETGGRLAAVAVREWAGSSEIAPAVAKVADDLTAAGLQVLFIPMHIPGDLGIAEKTAALAREECFILREGLPVPTLLGVMSQAQLVIGMRVHALIFASAAGVPSVGISYDPKVENFLRRVKQKDAVRVEDLTYEVLHAAVFDTLLHLDAARERLQETVPVLRELAWRNARLAVDLARS